MTLFYFIQQQMLDLKSRFKFTSRFDVQKTASEVGSSFQNYSRGYIHIVVSNKNKRKMLKKGLRTHTFAHIH